MKYFYIEPEVAGGLGENTVMDPSVHPPIVCKLNYEFDGWPEDVLLESFPCFIVTEATKKKLQSIGLTGLKFDQVMVTTTEFFRERHPNPQLPEYKWLQVVGQPGRDDFGIAQDFRLVISERALGLLQRLGISNALVKPFKESK